MPDDYRLDEKVLEITCDLQNLLLLANYPFEDKKKAVVFIILCLVIGNT